MNGTLHTMVVLASITAIVLGIGIGSTRQAHAYLDPGTGSLIIQALIGALAVGAGIVAMLWALLRQKMSALVSKVTKRVFQRS